LVVQVEKDLLYATFDVDCFASLQTNIDTMSPSMVEYYLGDISSSVEDKSYINKSNIQQTIALDEYSIYKDYSDNLYIESVARVDDGTLSLW